MNTLARYAIDLLAVLKNNIFENKSCLPVIIKSFAANGRMNLYFKLNAIEVYILFTTQKPCYVSSSYFLTPLFKKREPSHSLNA